MKYMVGLFTLTRGGLKRGGLKSAEITHLSIRRYKFQPDVAGVRIMGGLVNRSGRILSGWL